MNYILQTPHTVYLGHLLSRALERYGMETKVQDYLPAGPWPAGNWYVISPQVHERLPSEYVAVQVEQPGSRWWTDAYLEQLRSAKAVLEIFRPNLEYLLEAGIERDRLFYLPLQVSLDYLPRRKPPRQAHNLFFYGDHSSNRRSRILADLEKAIEPNTLDVAMNVYGERLHRRLCRNWVVLNIHYEQPGYLEQVRIYEALSAGCAVISETAVDLADHEELAELVDWVEPGDVEQMANVMRFYTGPYQLAWRLRQNEIKTPQFRRFDYHFSRYLLFTGQITFEHLQSNIGPLPLKSINVLSLPETPERYEHALASYGDVHPVHGLRHEQGWRGCGMTYKHLFQSALEHGYSRIVVMEDDAVLPRDWREQLDGIYGYLDSLSGQWDVFAGLIAEISPQAKVSHVSAAPGREYIHLNKMVSGVFNVYNVESIGPLLARWDEATTDHLAGQFDRWLERIPNLRVVTSNPWFAGHAPSLHSTMWSGGDNGALYDHQIARATRRLHQLVKEYKDER